MVDREKDHFLRGGEPRGQDLVAVPVTAPPRRECRTPGGEHFGDQPVKFLGCSVAKVKPVRDVLGAAEPRQLQDDGCDLGAGQ